MEADSEALPGSERGIDCLGALFDLSFDCVFLKDTSLRYVRINPAMERMLGEKAEILLGKTDEHLLGNERWKYSSRLEARVLRGETTAAEFDTKLEGRDVALRIRETPLFDREGRITGLFGVARDVSHNGQFEKDLKDSEDRLRIIFERAPDTYFLCDTRGFLLDGNKAAEALTGYPREKLIGKNFLKLNLLPPEQLPKAAKAVLMSSLGRPTGPEEYTLVRRDLTKIPVEITLNRSRSATRT